MGGIPYSLEPHKGMLLCIQYTHMGRIPYTLEPHKGKAVIHTWEVFLTV